MAGTVYFCCTDQRRAAIDGHASLNGIDYLEVGDLAPGELDALEAAEYATLPASERDRLLWQRRLTVVFVNPLTPSQANLLDPDHVRIIGGDRPDSRNIGVSVLSVGAAELVLRTTSTGDFSVYRLVLVTGIDDPAPPPGFDPILSSVDFSFKVECPTEFDCAPTHVCPPQDRPRIDLDYLARDYASFRRFLLDRMSTNIPGWRERHAADLGIALVEVMAYVGDQLAYRQDAIATEAYLGTARRRTSVRRHARLVDYPMHEGCNARAWIHLTADSTVPVAGTVVPRIDPVTEIPTRFLTRVAGARQMTIEQADEALASQRPEVFEPLSDVRIFEAHNRIDLHTWGAEECCLPRGATRATLAGKVTTLAAGDPLLLEEVAGTVTGVADDADPTHRHVVRLTGVTFGKDPLAVTDDVTAIEWEPADALPFPLCVSSRIIDPSGATEVKATAVARGNLVLVDHGLSIMGESLPGSVPDARIHRYPAAADRCDPVDADPVPPRYAPTLGRGPLTHTSTYAPDSSAGVATATDVTTARPAIGLLALDGSPWYVRRDLLRSGATARDFVAEVESDGTTHLRFGDGLRHGARPAAGTTFDATYRVGNGSAGNVGRDAIAHIAPPIAGVDAVRNPLAASGGSDPETIEDVRRFAPVAFQTQERAVTAADYARMAERHSQVQRAAGTFRWTGSWRTAFVTVDPRVSVQSGQGLESALAQHLEPYRMAGQDVHVDEPRYVPLEVEMAVCVRREYLRADVKRELLEVFSGRRLPDGRTGSFHPDNFSFGQPLYLSSLYAAAYAVEGVESVTVTTFQRLRTPDPLAVDAGKLEFGRLEIAQLDNDPSRPERGVMRIGVEGGK
jgi:Baseplate J-like protein